VTAFSENVTRLVLVRTVRLWLMLASVLDLERKARRGMLLSGWSAQDDMECVIYLQSHPSLLGMVESPVNIVLLRVNAAARSLPWPVSQLLAIARPAGH